MAAPHGNNFPAAGGEAPPSAAQRLYLSIYHRCLLHHLSVLDTEILKIESASSCSSLLDEVISMSEGSSYSGLLDEIEKTRAKRARIYNEFQMNLQQIQDCQDGSVGAGVSNTANPCLTMAEVRGPSSVDSVKIG
ncbi:hypothetical protein ACP70R_018052 [Stipagrostis hirtigluma subsp. patula]